MKQTRQLTDAEIARLYDATQRTLEAWIARTRDEVGDGFPEKVTAFREGMAVHGRYGKPCPVCGAPVQRIVYADNECNYCATCQTEGRLLSDRALSRLLRAGLAEDAGGDGAAEARIATTSQLAVANVRTSESMLGLRTGLRHLCMLASSGKLDSWSSEVWTSDRLFQTSLTPPHDTAGLDAYRSLRGRHGARARQHRSPARSDPPAADRRRRAAGGRGWRWPGPALALLLSFAGGWGCGSAGQVLLALMLVQWFVILHECGHDTLFRTRRWHAVAGRLAAILLADSVPLPGRASTAATTSGPAGRTSIRRPRRSCRGRSAAPSALLVNICWRLWIPLFSVLYRLTNYWHLPRLLRMFPKPADRRAIAARHGGCSRRSTPLLVVLAGPARCCELAALALLLSLVIEDLLLLSQHTHVPQNVSDGAAVQPFPAVEQEPFTRSLRLPPVGVGVRPALRRARAAPHVSVRARLSPAPDSLHAGERDRLVALDRAARSRCAATSCCSRTGSRSGYDL